MPIFPSSAAKSHVVVAIDFTPASDHALRQAVAIIHGFADCELDALHVIDPHLPGLLGPGELSRMTEEIRAAPARLEKYVLNGLARSSSLGGRGLGIHVRTGSASEEIVVFAESIGAEMIVVGTHGRRGLRKLLLGSVAARVVERATCPVLIAAPQPVERIPQIIPPCPDCLETQRLTNKARWWCDRHSEHHARAHSYSYTRAIPVHTPDASVDIRGTH
jgi:nucleotide-binding universal stress UspA family protein